MPSVTLTIEQECPQCGAPVTLEESDRFFACDHCRVRLYLTGKGVPRYYIPPAPKVGEEVIFVPYWHLRGTQFVIRPSEVKTRALDATSRAVDLEVLSPNLGLRAQAMKLRMAVDGVPGRFLRTSLPYREMVSTVLSRSRGLEAKSKVEEVVFRDFLTSRASLVYTPFVLRGGEIIDAVLDRPLRKFPEGMPEGLGPAADTGRWQVNFMAALCPNCGGDLPGEKKGAVFLCGGCHRAWRLHGSGLHQVPFEVAGEDGDVHLPFWKIAVRVKGLPLASFADLVRIANLPLAPKEEWEEEGLSFWSPAFRVRPRLFQRLARQLTSVPPAKAGEEHVPRGEAFPVTLDFGEAFEGIRITLATLVVNKRKIFPALPAVEFKPLRAGLVYLPFAVKGGDFIQTTMRFGIRRNALRR